MRYFMCISYDGTNYHGWQRQANSPNTVQEKIESCLSTLLKKEVPVIGCGRTDTGVHAKQYYLHFDFDVDIEITDLIHKANRILPRSIVVHDVFRVKDDLHARFDAYSRSYVYRIKLNRDPFDFHHHHYIYKQPVFDLVKLNELAYLVLTATDFQSFCKAHSDNKTTLCVITHSKWCYIEEQKCFEYHISANRFLRGMIRLLVGSMINVLRERESFESFKNALFSQKELTTPWSIDGNGLILYGIEYNFGNAANH
jgi:tRNA pseudouridine38-40 synthase